METLQGPRIFLAQFVRDSEPFNSIEGLGRWVSGFGHKGVQIPTWESSLIDLEKASSSKTYCDEYRGRLAEMGLEIIELGSRWRPILDYARDRGVTFGYELHPGSDLYDGATFEMFLDKVDEHPSACITYDPSHFLLQQLDYTHFIELYHDRIRAFHVKDAEFNPDGRIIEATDVAFDDFAGGKSDRKLNRRMLGLE